MPSPSDIKIGTFAGGVGGLVTLASLDLPSPLMDFLEASQEDVMGDATIEANGWMECEWHYDYLTAAQYTALATYKTSKTTQVYIRTRKTANAYGNFLANMVWPERERWSNNCVLDFNLRFVFLTEV
jgi:hypothetical protein